MTSQPAFRSIYGTTPGLLDPTQPARLHRISGSTLSFASFHPLTAYPREQNLENLSLDDEPIRPKRIVIETTPGPEGTSSWRFVPRARLGHGVDSEGSWPRLVNICGEIIYCSQDQWDIHKLDTTGYECFVPAPPNIPTISRKKGKEKAADNEPERHTMDDTRPTHKSKRRLSTPSDDETPRHSRSGDMSELGSDPAHPIPVDDEEVEVEDLLGETSRGGSMPPGNHKSSSRAGTKRGTRNTTDSRRQWRRENAASQTKPPSIVSDDVQEIDMVDLTADDHKNGQSEYVPYSNTAKRKSKPQCNATDVGCLARFVVSPEPRESSPNRPGDSAAYSSDDAANPPRKRRRTVPPEAYRQAFDTKRTERERRRMESFRARFDSKKTSWHDKFFRDLMAEIPEEFGSGGNTHGPEDPPDQAQQAPGDATPGEEALRQAAIEESRRKLAELEKDKPLWEDAARRRMEAERAEEERRRARAEYEQEQRRRQQQQQRWSFGPWTTARALERYKVLSEAFDNAKFTEDNPATFDTIPWPVLQSPAMLSIEDIDWNAVEAFFRSVRSYMRPQDYKAFVQESHRRFHPDRWRARGVLRNVSEEETRSCLEVASNTVAQALTPLWREVVKGG
ncbi:uncharacterized protein B0H18DRAFT_1082142 [Fomitopsis serialis]|uniref:uncharacterized protein n=1 Tax=Fomitopsis serialis TaxID=139415 RepID=UPI00200897FE|nr:uncharacterized protein B0H18DRAFT_1082142 [Neoantrodia serialis]KAH9935289.1 hypothetical protein B0H18DRAFT_1082142 [Neoantrodia serialis]